MAGKRSRSRASVTIDSPASASTIRLVQKNATPSPAARALRPRKSTKPEPDSPLATPKRPIRTPAKEREPPFPFDEADLLSLRSASKLRPLKLPTTESAKKTPRKKAKTSWNLAVTPTGSRPLPGSSSSSHERTPKSDRSRKILVSKGVRSTGKRSFSNSDSELELIRVEEDEALQGACRTPATRLTVPRSRHIPNVSSTLPPPSSSLSPLSSRIFSSPLTEDSRSYSDEEEHLPGMKEIIALCDAKSEAEDQIVDRSSAQGAETTRFKPTPLPDGVDIGDSVFVKLGYNWYFGKLVGYTPATNFQDQKRGKDIWTVKSMLGSQISKRPEGNILTVYDERIATCTLAEWTTRQREFPSDALFRPPTPEPSTVANSPVDSEQPFDVLSRHRQLYAIRPHLQAIISDAYPPAKWRADLFFGSAKDRTSLNQKVIYGDIHDDEISDVIIPELKRWARRAEVVRGKGRQGQPPKPTGSDRYDRMRSAAQVDEYITNVLLPEAIIELCIRSYNLTADGQEEEEDHPTTDELEMEQAEDDLLPFELNSTEGGDTGDHTELMDTAIRDVKAALSAENPFSSSYSANRRDRHTQQDPSFRLYEKARSKLLKLHAENDRIQWESRAAELRSARRQMRRKLGLPEDEVSKEEMVAWKAEKAGNLVQRWSGRRTKAVNYRE
ncbi:hypothetical protein I317_06429 [Kwoniella heveanensis CBS 569]|nr:hypothetical protein I317_06429 [Kwoniella heveanensis CBS 569]